MSYQIKVTANNKREADKNFKKRVRMFTSDIKINKVTKTSQVIHIYTYDITLTKKD